MSLSAVENLKRQMREKFPQAHGLRAVPEVISSTDQLFLAETFPVGAISEVVPASPGAGLLLMLAGLLGEPEEASLQPDMVLIDGADSFDPDSYIDAACSKLMWVRCRSALEMVKAADLLIHDGNLPFILLDAAGLNRGELTKIPASAWWRMRQTAERFGIRVVIMVPSPLVPCASLRLTLSANLTLQAFEIPRTELLPRLRSISQSVRHAT